MVGYQFPNLRPCLNPPYGAGPDEKQFIFFVSETTLVHGTHIGVNLGPMLGLVLKNRYHLMTLILHWKLLAKRPFREKTAF